MTPALQTANELQPALPEPEGADEELVDDGDDVKLDMAADSLLAELNDSQEEVQRMLKMQQANADELGTLKDQLAAELSQLQEEAWRLQTFNELEVLKRQLDALNGLEADLDAAEAVLDAGDEVPDRSDTGVPQTARKPVSEDEEDEGDDDDDDDDVEYNAADVEALQAKLDKELADMFAQLQAVRSEAMTVSARKAQLEAELKTLLGMQLADGDFEEGAVEEEEEEEAVGAVEVLPAAEAATDGPVTLVASSVPVS